MHHNFRPLHILDSHLFIAVIVIIIVSDGPVRLLGHLGYLLEGLLARPSAWDWGAGGRSLGGSQGRGDPALDLLPDDLAGWWGCWRLGSRDR